MYVQATNSVLKLFVSCDMLCFRMVWGIAMYKLGRRDAASTVVAVIKIIMYTAAWEDWSYFFLKKMKLESTEFIGASCRIQSVSVLSIAVL